MLAAASQNIESLTRLKHLAAQSRHNSMILFNAVGSIADL